MSTTVAAIVASAGLSRRMGTCKQLLPLGGKTVLACCLETLLAGGITDIVVVVGVQGEEVAAETRRYPVRIAVNPDPAGDMASSVRAGYSALGTETSAVIVALCDYPLVTAATIAALASAHAEESAAIIIPDHDGRKGHPTLFPSSILAELSAGGTLRDLVQRDLRRVRRLAVNDPGILLDMDTPEDYHLLQQRLAK